LSKIKNLIQIFASALENHNHIILTFETMPTIVNKKCIQRN